MINSYTSAGLMPWKLLQHKNAVVDGSIRPIHLQLIPTNKCNQNCIWCSCSKVDRTKELSIEEIRDIFKEFATLGTEAVTITGGGEPTVHKDFESILVSAIRNGIKCGVVSNGINLVNNSIDMDILNNTLTWLRVSVYNTHESYDARIIEEIGRLLPDVDIGVSFTVAQGTKVEIAKNVCTAAVVTPNVTHVRFVQDILHANDKYNISSMDWIKKNCQTITHKAIFQYRNIFTQGCEQCLISLLKPMIGADGYVYPCCGVQYAGKELRTLPENFRIGKWDTFKYANSFNGSICSRCYYDEYNRVLSNLIQPLHHKEFV